MSKSDRIANLFVEAGPAAAQLDPRQVLYEIAEHNPIVAGALSAYRAHPEAITLEQAMLVSLLAMDAALETLAQLAVNTLAGQIPQLVLHAGGDE